MEVKGVAKNPLAIIALFISFMYGAASLILGTAVDKLDAINARALVIFLVTFPLLILFSFLYLVVRHHRKLYAPGDFRSDESFLAGVPTVERQQSDEGDAGEPVDVPEPAPEEPPPAGPQKGKRSSAPKSVVEMAADMPVSSFRAANRSRLAETLVADFYQKRFGGLLKRNVQFAAKDGRKLVFDFAIEVRETVYVGEVMYSRLSNLRTAVDAALSKLFIFDRAVTADNVRFVKIAAVVFEDRPDFAIQAALKKDIQSRMAEVRRDSSGADLIVEAFTMTELLNSGQSTAESPAASG